MWLPVRQPPRPLVLLPKKWTEMENWKSCAQNAAEWGVNKTLHQIRSVLSDFVILESDVM